MLTSEEQAAARKELTQAMAENLKRATPGEQAIWLKMVELQDHVFGLITLVRGFFDLWSKVKAVLITATVAGLVGLAFTLVQCQGPGTPSPASAERPRP